MLKQYQSNNALFAFHILDLKSFPTDICSEKEMQCLICCSPILSNDNTLHKLWFMLRSSFHASGCHKTMAQRSQYPKGSLQNISSMVLQETGIREQEASARQWREQEPARFKQAGPFCCHSGPSLHVLVVCSLLLILSVLVDVLFPSFLPFSFCWLSIIGNSSLCYRNVSIF